jgi:hypothetical protein
MGRPVGAAVGVGTAGTFVPSIVVLPGDTSPVVIVGIAGAAFAGAVGLFTAEDAATTEGVDV